MNKRLSTILACALILALLAGTTGAFAECAHTNKRQVTVAQDPVYVSEGPSSHRVTVDTMIYWECTSCGLRFSGKPGESTTTTEAHTMQNNVCTKCGYAIPGKDLDKQKSNGSITLNVGDQLQLNATFASASGWTVSGYKSSRPKVATVSSSGLVKAVAEGKAKITVTTANKRKATITIQVVDPYKATGVTIAQGKSATLNMGATLQLTATVAPATARTTLTWSSSKSKVASVDANGLVTPHAEGTAKITVRTANKKKATIKVKVVDPYKPSGISIPLGKTATLSLGQTLSLSAVLAPSTAKSTLTWTSNKPRVATVDANGVVTPHAEGTAKITVRTANKKKATIKVTVVDPSKPTGVSIAQGAALTVKAGVKLQLSAVLAPSTAKSALTWSTNKTYVAGVDANGMLTAVAPGTAKVTVQTYNRKRATIIVTVTQ